MASNMKRISKKQQYINGLEHDLKYFQTELSTTTKQFIWWLGTQYSRYTMWKMVKEYQAEIAAINNPENKEYKPWK